ncbi:hypothetical protein GQ42DRAFT_180276 [Ramicandelaber brevisporus]|nr:hypothetical protein GQ42DRAFT_180276 [Ramicandelaber brevisporus]
MTGSNSRQSPASDTSSTGVATAPGYHKPSSELQQQQQQHQQQQQQQSCVIPEQRANILSRLFFEWLTPTLWLGYKRPLEQGDLYELDETLQSNVQTERVENELDKERAKPNPSLFKALWHVHGRMFILAAIIKLVWAILQCTAPLVVGKITSFIMECYAADKAGRRDLAPEAYKGYLYALGYVAMLVVASFCNNHSFHLAVRTAIHLKTTVITLVFRKSLVVSNRARETVSTGRCFQ